MALFTSRSTPFAQAVRLERQGEKDMKAERWSQALQAFWEAGQIYSREDQTYPAARCLLQVAQLAALIGQPTMARRMLAACVPVFAEKGDAERIARCVALVQAMEDPNYRSAE